MQKRKVVKQFINQLRVVWNDDPKNLIKCFRMYLGFLVEYADPPGTPIHKKLAAFTSWQIKDMEMAIYHPKINTKNIAHECGILRTRRGGKSRDLSIINTFFAMLGLQVIWRAPFSDQLRQAGKWFLKNPFVEETKIFTHSEIRIYDSPAINIGPLSEARSASAECDILVFDEGGQVDKQKKVYEYYLATRPMVSTSPYRHVINASTPARDSAWQDEWESIKRLEQKLNIKLTSSHNCDDCWWIPPSFIASEREKYPEWYIAMNYYCQWTVPFGAVFTKIITLGNPKYPEFSKDFYSKRNAQPSVAGADFNAGDKDHPHYLVIGEFDDNFIYVYKEIPFADNELGVLFNLKKQYPNISLEVEDGGYNTGYTDQTKRAGLQCIYFQWSEEEKHQRVQEVRKRIVIIDKNRCPLTYKNLMNAAWDRNARLPKLEKRSDQHGLDCLLHMMHPHEGEIYVAGSRRKIRAGEVFERPTWDSDYF